MSAVAGFTSLKNLVLDGNALTHDTAFPPMPVLTTLWVNDNHIAELQPFLDTVKASCPKLTYLSMLKNPACPNFFTGKQQEEYKRYRCVRPACCTAACRCPSAQPPLGRRRCR